MPQAGLQQGLQLLGRRPLLQLRQRSHNQLQGAAVAAAAAVGWAAGGFRSRCCHKSSGELPQLRLQLHLLRLLLLASGLLLSWQLLCPLSWQQRHRAGVNQVLPPLVQHLQALLGGLKQRRVQTAAGSAGRLQQPSQLQSRILSATTALLLTQRCKVTRCVAARQQLLSDGLLGVLPR